jgi:hypothetical protein
MWARLSQIHCHDVDTCYDKVSQRLRDMLRKVNQSLPSIPRKKIYVFLHLEKSGGSSLWYSLASTFSKDCNKYAVLDSHFHSLSKYDTSDRQNEATDELVRQFMRSAMDILLLHYHDYGVELDGLFRLRQK